MHSPPSITVNSKISDFANSVIRHTCHVKNSRLGHDLPISVNDSDLFREGFSFTKVTRK